MFNKGYYSKGSLPSGAMFGRSKYCGGTSGIKNIRYHTIINFYGS